MDKLADKMIGSVKPKAKDKTRNDEKKDARVKMVDGKYVVEGNSNWRDSKDSYQYETEEKIFNSVEEVTSYLASFFGAPMTEDSETSMMV